MVVGEPMEAERSPERTLRRHVKYVFDNNGKAAFMDLMTVSLIFVSG